MADEPRIVEAVGTASTKRLRPGQTTKSMETVMSEAVMECARQGITDPKQIQQAMRAAYAKAKADYAAIERRHAEVAKMEAEAQAAAAIARRVEKPSQ